MTTLKSLVDERNACSIPWLYTEINLQTGAVKPCCKYTNDLGNPTDFKTIWQGSQYQTLRSDIRNNIKHAACAACDVPDDVFSYKSFKNKHHYPRLARIKIDNPALPEIFNISLKNTCNLHCRMCGPGSSSKFFGLMNRSNFLTGLYQFKQIDNRFDISQLSGSFVNARHLIITGGEPMMDDDCFQLVEMIRKESPLLESLVFSTNMTYLNLKLLDLLNSIPRLQVMLNTSIDGPQHIHEYIRGCNWNQMVNNLKTIKANYPFRFGINSTISALNIGYMVELIDSIVELEKETNIKFTHIMSSPVLEEHLHPGIIHQLGSKVIDLYQNKLLQYKPIPLSGANELVDTALGFLKKPAGNLQLFQKFINEFDRVTATDYSTVYPEIHNELHHTKV